MKSALSLFTIHYSLFKTLLIRKYFPTLSICYGTSWTSWFWTKEVHFFLLNSIKTR